ncbi:MAG: peptidoglycan DD-metalloendopeptidase family protein, partial [Caldisericia bacterium]|nr:peptidoglycan DD-metalloendopeptidase family protein [Caldisericia bacterium]
ITRNSTINKLVNGVVVALRDLKEESANQFQNQIKLEEKEIRLHELEAKQIEEQKALLSLKNKLDQIIAGISYDMKTSKELSKKYTQRLDREDANIDNIAKKILERNRSHKTDGRFIWPVSGRLSSPYGMRMHPIHGTYRMHYGIDISHSKIIGEPIHAAADGLISLCRWYSGYGNCVMINHGTDDSGKVFQTLYAHMSRYGTRLNTRVKKGQVIGYIGSTGRSTGPHLHFEVRVNGNCENPEKYLPKRNTGNKL